MSRKEPTNKIKKLVELKITNAKLDSVSFEKVQQHLAQALFASISTNVLKHHISLQH